MMCLLLEMAATQTGKILNEAHCDTDETINVHSSAYASALTCTANVLPSTHRGSGSFKASCLVVKVYTGMSLYALDTSNAPDLLARTDAVTAEIVST